MCMLCLRMHSCAFPCVPVCTCVFALCLCISMCARACMPVCMHVCCLRVHVCILMCAVCMYACVHVCAVFVCVCVCISVCPCVHEPVCARVLCLCVHACISVCAVCLYTCVHARVLRPRIAMRASWGWCRRPVSGRTGQSGQLHSQCAPVAHAPAPLPLPLFPISAGTWVRVSPVLSTPGSQGSLGPVFMVCLSPLAPDLCAS